MSSVIKVTRGQQSEWLLLELTKRETTCQDRINTLKHHSTYDLYDHNDDFSLSYWEERTNNIQGEREREIELDIDFFYFRIVAAVAHDITRRNLKWS